MHIDIDDEIFDDLRPVPQDNELYMYAPHRSKLLYIKYAIKALGAAIEEGDPQTIQDLWLHHVKPLLDKEIHE
jgi:hypothetical protein